jgi:hypothetical protein
MKKPTHLKMAMYAETCSERQWKPTDNKAELHMKKAAKKAVKHNP